MVSFKTLETARSTLPQFQAMYITPASILCRVYTCLEIEPCLDVNQCGLICDQKCKMQECGPTNQRVTHRIELTLCTEMLSVTMWSRTYLQKHSEESREHITFEGS